MIDKKIIIKLENPPVEKIHGGNKEDPIIRKSGGGGGKMSSSDIDSLLSDLHTEDMQDIITKVPSWLLRWGITVFFSVLLFKFRF